MKQKLKRFIDALQKLECSKEDRIFLTTQLIYNAYLTSNRSKVINYKIDFNSTERPINSELKEAFDDIAYTYFPKKDFRDLSQKCIEKFTNICSINKEFYTLVDKLLDLKVTDVLLHFNAYDESFLMHSNNYLKLKSLKLNAIYYPDNLYASKLIDMRLILNDLNYSSIEDIDIINKFKPNKIFFEPNYIWLDKFSPYSLKKGNYWKQLIELTKNMQSGSKVVCLVPNVFLSNSLYKLDKQYLLEHELVESIISIPLRYYSANLNSEVSLLILSKNNKKIKICNIKDFFTTNDLRMAKLNDVTEFIIDNYKNTQSFCNPQTLIDNESNMLLSNIIDDDTYKFIDNPKPLNSVAKVFTGTKKTKNDFREYFDQINESQYCLLDSTNINEGDIDYENLTKIIYDLKFENLFLKNGDVVLTNKSSRHKVAIIDSPDKKLLPLGSMIIIRPYENILDGYYLKMFLESETGVGILSSFKRGELSSTLNSHDISKMCIPYRPLEDQMKIINKYKVKTAEIKNKKSELNNLYKELQIILKEIK